MMEREYFDAKFDGIKDLINLQKENMDNHISAVSSNVKRLETAFSDHKESSNAHGLAEGRRFTDSMAKWGSVVLAGVAIALGVRKH